MTYRFLLGNLAALLLPWFGLTAETPGFDTLNKTFGIPIWSDDNLWDDTDADVAGRLAWPEESRTSGDSSFRLYAAARDKVIGARPFSLALYGRNGKQIGSRWSSRTRVMWGVSIPQLAA